MQKLFQTIGLPLSTWQMLADVKDDLILLGIVNSQASLSDVVEYTVRHGRVRVGQLLEKERAEVLA